MNVTDSYVSTSGSLLQMIYFSRYMESIQHYTLDNPFYNQISIENYKQEILTTFMLELLLYLIISGSNIEHSMQAFHKKNTYLRKINFKDYCQHFC